MNIVLNYEKNYLISLVIQCFLLSDPLNRNNFPNTNSFRILLAYSKYFNQEENLMM